MFYTLYSADVVKSEHRISKLLLELPSSLNVQLGLTDEQKGKILIKDLLLENKQILKIHNRNVFIRCLLLKDGF